MFDTHGIHLGGDHERAIREVFREVTRARAHRDALALTGWYAPDAWITGPGVHLAGREAIRAALADAFAGPLRATRNVHDIQGIRLVDATTALVRTSSMTLLPGRTEPLPGQREEITWVLSRYTGRWLIEAQHSSPPPPDGRAAQD